MKSFDEESLQAFKQAYKKAKADREESFTFQGNEYLVSYAKYLIQYLDTRIGG